MSDAYFQDLLQRYQRGECPPAEQREVEHWYAALEQHVPPSTPLTAQEQAALQHALWARIAQQTGLETPVIPLTAVPTPWYGKAPIRWVAAAAVAVGVGLAALYQLPGFWVGSKWPPATRRQRKYAWCKTISTPTP